MREGRRKMLAGFLTDREKLVRIEIACARVSDLLMRARRLEADGHLSSAEIVRQQAVDLLDELERPGPAPTPPGESLPRGA